MFTVLFTAAGVLADAAASVDVADYCDDKHVHDAYNDARYDKHAHDAVTVDAVRQAVRADGVVLADVVAPGRMHKFLITGIDMRIIVFS